MTEETPQRTYRIVGVGSDAARTTLATGLTEWKALELRARLVTKTEFSKVLVERESTGKSR